LNLDAGKGLLKVETAEALKKSKGGMFLETRAKTLEGENFRSKG